MRGSLDGRSLGDFIEPDQEVDFEGSDLLRGSGRSIAPSSTICPFSVGVWGAVDRLNCVSPAAAERATCRRRDLNVETENGITRNGYGSDVGGNGVERVAPAREEQQFADIVVGGQIDPGIA